MTRNPLCEVAVVGGGPVGLVAALALAHQGFQVVVAGPPHRTPGLGRDLRTAALFAGSIELLHNLGVWPELVSVSAPIHGIRLIDATGGLLRAPEVLFRAHEIGLDAFGYNVPNAALQAALHSAALRNGLPLIETAAVTGLDLGPDGAVVRLAEGGQIEARLVAAADGRRSVCRGAAGIGTRHWTYDQSALVCSFSHQRPHGGISTEFHGPAGPLTTVPLPGSASSLVWVERPGPAGRLAALDDATFRAALEARLRGLLGTVGEVSPRALFPLTGLDASALAQNRVVLLGEAAHVIPPIGAQGLNLGLRDAAALADCLSEARAGGQDIGAAEVLAAYNRARAGDVASRTWSVDLLNRSLLTGFLPVQLARGLGLVALKTIGPLRRFLVREGLQPSGTLPSLMRPADGGNGHNTPADASRGP